MYRWRTVDELCKTSSINYNLDLFCRNTKVFRLYMWHVSSRWRVCHYFRSRLVFCRFNERLSLLFLFLKYPITPRHLPQRRRNRMCKFRTRNYPWPLSRVDIDGISQNPQLKCQYCLSFLRLSSDRGIIGAYTTRKREGCPLLSSHQAGCTDDTFLPRIRRKKVLLDKPLTATYILTENKVWLSIGKSKLAHFSAQQICITNFNEYCISNATLLQNTYVLIFPDIESFLLGKLI